MFKKFINFFFEEEELDTEVEHEEVEDVQETFTPMKEEPVFYEVAHKPSTFIDLESTPKEQKSNKHIEDHVERQERTDKRTSGAAKKPVTTDYVFTSVISPIFGSSEEANSVKPVTSAPKSSYNTSAAPAKDSLLGTIISPIYGKVVTQTAEKPAAVTAPAEVSLPPLFDLDELIAKNQKLQETSEDDGLHQFSLFDVEQTQSTSVERTREAFGIGEFFDDTRK